MDTFSFWVQPIPEYLRPKEPHQAESPAADASKGVVVVLKKRVAGAAPKSAVPRTRQTEVWPPPFLEK